MSRTGINALTVREREIIHELADDASYSDVAAIFGITYATVGVTVFHASRKLGVRGRKATLERFQSRPTCACGEPLDEPGGQCGFCLEEAKQASVVKAA